MRRAARHAKRTAEACPKAEPPHEHAIDRRWLDEKGLMVYVYCSCGATGKVSLVAYEAAGSRQSALSLVTWNS
jgi:hypothetical protein